MLFALLLALVLWIFPRQEQSSGTLLGADRNFAVADAADIQKVFLANRIDGTTILLERQGREWRVNGVYPARANAVENLLDALTRVQMMYKPPAAAVPNMLKDLATRGIKVEVYGRGDKPLKVYYVGGSTADERGTYMIMEGSEQPYVTHIPSWEGNLRFRYNLKEEDWRDRSVFPFAMDSLRSIKVEYPTRREQSFILDLDERRYRLAPFYDYQEAIEGVPERDRIEFYLETFPELKAETFRNDYSKQDSVRSMLPFCRFYLEDLSGRERTVSFFPIFPQSGGDAPAVERYFVDVDGQDFMLTQHRVVQKVFRGYDFFFSQ